MKIILSDSLALNYEDESYRLPEKLKDLCAVLIADSKGCNRPFILDPTLIRLDLEKEFSLKTNIEKGGAKNVDNPKVIGKLIQKNFNELSIPEYFTIPKKTNDSLINRLNQRVNADSILVFSSDGSLSSYSLNGKQYKVYAEIDEIRTRMLSLLCENPKANFVLLIDPPRTSTLLPTPPSVTSTSPVSNTVVKGPRKPVGSSSPRRVVSYRDRGDLTIIKGSEGCDICTRYYSATDNLGHVRQVTQKNSTECCPCGKTIEMQGRTYRMECDGNGGNRLVLE